MRQSFAVVVEIKIRLGAIRFREFGVRGIGDVLVPAFPGCARARALLLHGVLKARFVELEFQVAHRVGNEIQRQAERVIKLERILRPDR